MRYAAPTRGLWWTLAAAGVAGFGTAIGVHPAIGYTDPVHLAPAVGGAAVYYSGWHDLSDDGAPPTPRRHPVSGYFLVAVT